MKSLFFVSNLNPSYREFHPWFWIEGDKQDKGQNINKKRVHIDAISSGSVMFPFVYSFGMSKMFFNAHFLPELIFATIDK